jgi:hypothetical protein
MLQQLEQSIIRGGRATDSQQAGQFIGVDIPHHGWLVPVDPPVAG